MKNNKLIRHFRRTAGPFVFSDPSKLVSKSLAIGLAMAVFLTGDLTAALKQQATGLYYLLQTPNNSDDAHADVMNNLNNPNVDGFRLRVSWKDIQPNNATEYKWNIIDDIRAILSNAGSTQKLGISISAGIVCPDWVYTSPPSVYKYTLDPSTGNVNEDVAGPPPYSLPFPWDQNFQTKWQTFVNAFAARYDNDPKLAYIVTTGYMQLATLNFIQNTDKSETFEDGSGSSGATSLVSNTARFTADDAVPRDGETAGRVISGDLTAFSPNTLISQVVTSKRVILTKPLLRNISGQHFVVEERLVGQGDDLIVNNLAKTPPPGAAWSPYSDIDPVSGGTGYASNAAFLDGAKKVVDTFYAAFHRTSLLISPQGPFPRENPYGSQTNLAIRDYVTDHAPSYQGGTDYTNLQAIVPPYPARSPGPNPNVKQCIHSSLQTDQLYAPPTPSPTIPPQPQPLRDLMESGYSKGAKALEMYKQDLETDNTNGRLDVLTSERLKFLSP